ncbi:hypothetical protein ES705_10937 [subsurface metagenome]
MTTKTASKKENKKSHRFAFLKISVIPHLAHLQAALPITRPKLAKEPNRLPADFGIINII